MKTITVHVSEEVYRRFQAEAAGSNRTAAELIRNAMDEYYANHIARSASIFDGEPATMGVCSPPEDLLGEMLP